MRLRSRQAPLTSASYGSYYGYGYPAYYGYYALRSEPGFYRRPYYGYYRGY